MRPNPPFACLLDRFFPQSRLRLVNWYVCSAPWVLVVGDLICAAL